ncbi:MAG TPA: hypothetical protein VL240_08380 [Candidatus Binatia bacterium]|nr:hypothetical protein [Candidatus Binatia bacterium]
MVRRKLVPGVLLAAVAVSVLWALRVEITYRRNVRHLPASFRFRRHVVTRLWKA